MPVPVTVPLHARKSGQGYTGNRYQRFMFIVYPKKVHRSKCVLLSTEAAAVKMLADRNDLEGLAMRLPHDEPYRCRDMF
jgi:hypothetical protein